MTVYASHRFVLAFQQPRPRPPSLKSLPVMVRTPSLYHAGYFHGFCSFMLEGTVVRSGDLIKLSAALTTVLQFDVVGYGLPVGDQMGHALSHYSILTHYQVKLQK